MTIESLRYHIHPENFEEFPIDWSGVFERKAPLWVEIGFGNGDFIVHIAKENPEVNIVGFELSLTSFVKTQKKLFDAGVENVRLVMVDGRFGLRELFHDESVERVYVNFPCPWSKKGYEDRRITAGDFIETLATVLVDNGLFELMTDDEDYAEEVHQKLIFSGYFKVEPIKVDVERKVKTKYERKWKGMGRHTFLIRAFKIKSARVERLIGGKVEDVHMKIESFDDSKLRELVGKVFKYKERVFVVKGVFSSPDGEHHLLKVISSDSGFEQHYNVSISKRKDFYIVKLDDTCQPYRTPAVKWSVREIARVVSGG